MPSGDEQILVGGDIPVVLRRSARARRMTLRVTRAEGQVVLTLPMLASLTEGRAFAESRAEWLRRVRAGMPPAAIVAAGARIPIEGELFEIEPASTRTVRIEGDRLLVPRGRPVGTVVASFLKHLAHGRLIASCDRHAEGLGRKFRAISLRDTRSRWGSCTADGRLMFSWRLAMAPHEVLDYVAAHEIAHLAYMDHSAAFWATTERLYPGYREQRNWLKQNGHELLAWRFTE
ncbi:SprT family zinc-dependent metalloprotease [Paracoccus sp. MBLB3053]|uniref:SprT family zinc-dependent metalloprotease n=1 Tax=Paracoccus aurantius TaxID=3073814 RepID=A0ABU2HV09_9RHOB|nr:SprT family zinc-dependent metalloprotease [Paracoccus sp. MBLB3053]MDS9468444.1 SprT family zinc-dependent metalloprotease [Paracoccus sp. MBLB3053]